MRPAERYEWIKTYLETKIRCDILDSDFVIAYAEHCNAKVMIYFYGAPGCPQLGRDLSAMHKAGILERTAIGLHGMAGMGFPRWVYVYKLPEKKDG